MYNVARFLILSILFTSCDKYEEQKLLSATNENSKYVVVEIHKRYTDKDSIWQNTTTTRNYDSQNRLISINHNSFHFYNSKNQINKIKYLYNRGGESFTRIINEDYIYDKKGNLVAVINYHNANGDTIKRYSYDSQNNLVFEGNSTISSEFKYYNGKLIEKKEIENGEVWKISTYKYDSLGRKEIEDWIFSDERKMRTYFRYNSKGKLISERDSSFEKTSTPNEYVEFKTEYYYSENDSISQIKHLGRIFSEKEFKIRGRETFQYIKK